MRLLNARGPRCLTTGLAADLDSVAVPPHGPLWGLKLGRWNVGDFEILARKEGDGPDGLQSGPFHTWCYVHTDVPARNSVLQPENWQLRRCGYVMWDVPTFTPETREEIGLFQRRTASLQRKGRRSLDGPQGPWDQMERSWAERIGVFRHGGQGYWARGDLSKVVWHNGSPSQTSF